MSILKKIIFFQIIFSTFVFTQNYYVADPNELLKNEFISNAEKKYISSSLFRPSINIDNLKTNWSLTFRADYFDNNGAPNLENTSIKWIGKGVSRYSSYKLSFINDFFFFSIEPYSFNSENLDYDVPLRKGIYSRMNDSRPHNDKPIQWNGVREFQFITHYKGIGVGISNANMWWGPGIHSSLQMSNNTNGFRYFSLGTFNEKNIGPIKLDLRYVFSKLDDRNIGEPYLSAILGSFTFSKNPIFTLGFSRAYISGHGNYAPDVYNLTLREAIDLPLEDLFLNKKQVDPNNPESAVDLWDEILVGYLVASFPRSGLKIYIEYGRDDHAWDWDDFKRQPDHSGAGVFGLRKYELFGIQNLIGGLEYTSLIKSKFWSSRVPGTWYSKQVYDYNSYNGRWWGAHSGPDSDDLYIYFGYYGNKFRFIPSFNYERHGVIDNNALIIEELSYLGFNPETGRWEIKTQDIITERQINIWPEVKMEFRLNIGFTLRDIDINFYYEHEVVDNLEFKWGEREGKVFWVSFDRTFNIGNLNYFAKNK
mgnify:CR=1 FL=1|tara:strand:- start:3332 stop:4936 length:1605 start_codon:yes stop_codon:yes gene_type:complete